MLVWSTLGWIRVLSRTSGIITRKMTTALVVFFLGGGGEIRTPATGLPVLTI